MSRCSEGEAFSRATQAAPLRGVKWYEPTEFGFEKDIKQRMEWWEKLKNGVGRGDVGRSDE